MINHHLNDEMILAYAAGALSVGHALVVASHLEICPHCAARLAEAEAIGGAMLDDCAQSAVSDDLFARMMETLEEPAPEGFKPSPSAPVTPAATAGKTRVPALLASVIGGDLDAIRWRTAGPGIKQFIVPLEGTEGETVRLLKLSPGFVTPEHSHHGSEMTLVLKGSFSDETGRYRVGDIQDADDDVHHQPIADTDEECICLTVTDAPLEFKSVITRLLQPIIGI
ncbi:ChrR family anti-sigma-E factor [uncultured Cohaesibacter sp.]|uniref:ChrR family anti-sigma-E factor n=1 Tax=uncultured Cohaesibacter sp. TaxID=1002546 RepID=UPI0029C93A20|nr:ChrR family anti-sigma-E factor [uncultured Cohaesibacter sp.]